MHQSGKGYIVFKKTVIMAAVVASTLVLVGCSNPTDTNKNTPTVTPTPDYAFTPEIIEEPPVEEVIWDESTLNGSVFDIVRGTMPKITLNGKAEDWTGTSTDAAVARFNTGSEFSPGFITTLYTGSTVITLSNSKTGENLSFTVNVRDGYGVPDEGDGLEEIPAVDFPSGPTQ